MANVELVIKISEELYKQVKDPSVEGGYIATECYNAIYRGTPLPKGHGQLGDLDALREEVSSWGMNDYEPSDFIDEIDRADVIIGADKE